MQFWKLKALTYLSGIYLYRWYALGLAWLVCLVGWGVVASIPDEYTAEAKVYIDTDTVMDPLLRGLTVNIDTGQQIAVMLTTLITRPTMEQVIHLTNPSANSLTPTQLETQVQRMQSKVSIASLGTKNYYEIGFTDNDAKYATSVTQTLLSILQDSRVGGTRLDMDAARAFINKQLTEYEDKLRDAEKRRADFQTANLELLGKGTASTRIDADAAALDQAQKDLGAAIARRDSVKDQLTTIPKTVSVDQRMFLGNTIGGVPLQAGNRVAPSATFATQRLQQAQSQLDELRTKYTENHPDVIATKKLIAQLQAQLSATPPDANPDEPSLMVPNPVYVQLQAKYSDEETNVALQHQRVTAAAVELDKAKKEASQAIDILAKYNGLDRDYANVQATYKALLQSREAASLSQARDDQNQGVSFRILEPAQLPQFPTGPNRLALNSIVLLMGLGAGAAVALLLFLNSGRFSISEDVVSQFGIPMIGVVTELPQAGAQTRNRLSALVLSASIGLLIFTYLGVVTFIRMSIYSLLGA